MDAITKRLALGGSLALILSAGLVISFHFAFPFDWAPPLGSDFLLYRLFTWELAVVLILTAVSGLIYGALKRDALFILMAVSILCLGLLKILTPPPFFTSGWFQCRFFGSLFFVFAALFFIRPSQQVPQKAPVFLSTIASRTLQTLLNNPKIVPTTLRLAPVIKAVLSWPIDTIAAIERQNLKWKERGYSLYFIFFVSSCLAGMGLWIHHVFLNETLLQNVSTSIWSWATIFLWLASIFFIFPSVYRHHLSFFSFALNLNVCLQGTAQVVILLYSRALFENSFYIAQGLEIAGSVVLLLGLWMDYFAVHPGTEDPSTWKFLRLKNRIEELEKSEEFWRLVTQNSYDIVVIMDFAGTITYVSPVVERVLGYQPEDLLGVSGFKHVHPDDIKTLMPVYNRLVKNPGSMDGTSFRFMAKDGSWHVVEAYGTSLFDNPAIKGVVSNTRDITLLRQTEAELRKTTAELSRSNTELAQFAYVASHDLQEPLRKIIAFGNLLKEECQKQLPKEGQDYCDRMQNAASRMQQLIEDLLSISRITTKAKPFENVSLDRVVKEVLGDLEIRIKETGAEVEYDFLPNVRADKTQMRQLFQNVIGNALKYRKKDVSPRIQIQYRSVDEVFSEFSIKDNGIGFDNRYADRIFKPFERLHGRTSEYDGTGIGLAICEKIVLRHGGKIRAESSEGVGSTFYFTLRRVPLEKGGLDGSEA